MDTLKDNRRLLMFCHESRLNTRLSAWILGVWAVLCACAHPAFAQAPAAARSTPGSAVEATRLSDYIVAIVNQESVTAAEVARRMEQARSDARRSGATLPADEALRALAVDALIEERVVLTHARLSGGEIDQTEIDRAVRAVAAQNQLDLAQLRQRLAAEGLDLTRFRAQLRDQLLVERAREREVVPRIRVSEAEIDAYLDAQRREAEARAEVNLAQILVAVPEGADAAQREALEARAARALARVRGGEPFETVARELSNDPRREQGGEIGMRPPSRLPDLFVDATRSLKPGEVTPTLLRSGAGLHILKVLARGEVREPRLTQTRVRHILLRLSDRLSAAEARDRLEDVRRQIERGQASFEDLARRLSEDGSAPQGGDLGWAVPGMMVPEFETAMNALAPGVVSGPVVSRFGVHLIQVLERREVDVDPRQRREQARSALRERKFDEAYAEWVRELRDRAYIELREPPL
jgi:peptidyl-prolyl cis-trans isomerase SurA